MGASYFHSGMFWLKVLSAFSSGSVGGAAGESPHPDGVPQGGRLRLRHLPPRGHGALAVPASTTRLGARQPEPSL